MTIKDLNTCTCCTCGFQWQRGHHGGQSCSEHLLKRIAKLEETLETAKGEHAEMWAERNGWQARAETAESELSRYRQGVEMPMTTYELWRVGSYKTLPCELIGKPVTVLVLKNK